MAQSAEGVPEVIGVMYTTWENKYDDLERLMAVVKEVEGRGR